MIQKNRYISHSHLTETEFLNILEAFVNEKSAVYAANDLKLNRNTVSRIYRLIRRRMFDVQRKELRIPKNIDFTKVDFAIRGLASRVGFSERGEKVHLAVLNVHSKVFAEVISDDNLMNFIKVINGKFKGDAQSLTVNNDIIETLIQLSRVFNFHVYRGQEKLIEISNNSLRMDEIDEFLEYSYERLKKFYGIKRGEFMYHLAECSYRFNCSSKNLFKILSDELAINPL